MRRTAVIASAVGVFVCVLAACGGSHNQRALQATTVVSRSRTDRVRLHEVVALSAIGSFEAACPPGERSWTLRFVPAGGASELFSYRVGTGARRTVNLNHPGNVVTVHLAANTTRTHEPADRFVPRDQPRGVLQAMSVPTTAPLEALIYQSTEPETLQADVRLALRSIAGESGQCILVGSTIHAHTYLNDRVGATP